jgi:hypothetical protein
MELMEELIVLLFQNRISFNVEFYSKSFEISIGEEVDTGYYGKVATTIDKNEEGYRVEDGFSGFPKYTYFKDVSDVMAYLNKHI